MLCSAVFNHKMRNQNTKKFRARATNIEFLFEFTKELKVRVPYFQLTYLSFVKNRVHQVRVRTPG